MNEPLLSPRRFRWVVAAAFVVWVMLCALLAAVRSFSYTVPDSPSTTAASALGYELGNLTGFGCLYSTLIMILPFVLLGIVWMRDRRKRS